MASRLAGCIVAVSAFWCGLAAAQSQWPQQTPAQQPGYQGQSAYQPQQTLPAGHQQPQVTAPQSAYGAQGPTNYGQPASSSPQPSVYGPQPPYQAMPPQMPSIERRTAAPAAVPVQRPGGPVAAVPGPQAPSQPQTASAPFVLTPHEQAALDQALAAWEERSGQIKMFECEFTRLTFGGQLAVSTQPGQPSLVETGEIKFQSPDKGLFRVVKPEEGEHWLCDGQSLFQYDYATKKVKEYPLPPDLQGKGIADGPMPFLFGASAAKLNERYFLRLITPAQVQQQQVWLEAYPRYQKDAAEFIKVEIILDRKEMLPIAIRKHETNGKTNQVYNLGQPKINAKNWLGGLDPRGWIRQDPFHARVPVGWTKEVQDTGTAQTAQQASRPATPGTR